MLTSLFKMFKFSSYSVIIRKCFVVIYVTNGNNASYKYLMFSDSICEREERESVNMFMYKIPSLIILFADVMINS